VSLRWLAVEIRELDPRDQALVHRHWEIGKIAESAARPYDFYVPWETAWLTYAGGREDMDMVLLAAFEDDELWGAARIDHSLHDNLHSASGAFFVHPERQRRGIGRALLRAGEAVARRRGRRVLMTEAFAPPDKDSPGLLFARAVGFRDAIEDRIKVVDLVDTEPTWAGLERRTAPRHQDYRIVTWRHVVPQRLVEDYCRLTEMFLAEAPMGELDVEPEKWDAARVAQQAERNRRTGRRVLAAGAVAPDGALVGLTEVILNERAAWRGFQSGTLVDPRHRGHALGLAMKLANHRQVRAVFPDCRVLMTGNAGVNVAMSAVNEALGYREVERCVELQKDI
jgi:GNAT superfamily N-acetyltransferase